MNRIRMLGLACAALLAGAAIAAPPTPEEDEARIEELMHTDSAPVPAAADTATPATPATPDEFTPVIAAVAPPQAQENDDWLVTHPDGDGLTFDDLATHVGRQVIIKTTNEREHRGKILAANTKEVTLSVRRSGGRATYVLHREQVQHITPLGG